MSVWQDSNSRGIYVGQLSYKGVVVTKKDLCRTLVGILQCLVFTGDIAYVNAAGEITQKMNTV